MCALSTDLVQVEERRKEGFELLPKYPLLPHQSVQFSSFQLLSHVQLFATPWIAARQASLSITNSQSLLKPMSIELVMPSSHLILCRPLLLLPPIPPSIRAFSSESTLGMRWPNTRVSAHINSEVLIGKQETTRIKINKKSRTETPSFSKIFYMGRIHSHLGLIGVAGTYFKEYAPDSFQTTNV